MSRRLIIFLAVLLIAAVAAPAAAISDGELDGDGHPAVVLILMEVDEEPAYRCSGTLIAPTFVLTAGHCAGDAGEFSGIRVFAEADVQNDPTYPYAGGPNTVEAINWAAHPEYTSSAFFLHDVGMIQLAEPIDLDPGEYGQLPSADSLDALKDKRGGQKVFFTSVGYGQQQTTPWFHQNVKIRMVAYPKLIQINVPGFTGDFSMLLSNNHSTGGTCFGDSGGPNFLGGSMTVAGVTSFGLNGNCGGTGGVFRVDRQNVLDFVATFMANPYTEPAPTP